MAARGKLNSAYQGMNWISPAKRLAIYLRDGLGCAYCGQGIEEGVRLTLDHLTPHSAAAKPDNSATNLVTACVSCNSSRGDRDLAEFCKRVAGYLNHGATGKAILAHVRATSARPLDLAQAKDLLARRGNFSNTLASLRQAA